MSGTQAEVERLVTEFFKGDRMKAGRWMATANHLLGGISPDDMLDLGRGEKLLKWVRERIADNASVTRRAAPGKEGDREP